MGALGVEGIITIIATITLAVVFVLLLTLIICKAFKFKIKIGRWIMIGSDVQAQLTPQQESQRKLEMKEIMQPIRANKTHKDCTLYTDIILLLEAAEDHTTEICSLNMKERLNNQMRVVEQNLEILYNSWNNAVYKKLEDVGISVADSLYLDLGLVLELIECMISNKVKTRIIALISMEAIEDKDPIEWERVKQLYTSLIVADMNKYWVHSTPCCVLREFNSRINETNHALIDLIVDKPKARELDVTLNQIMDGIRGIAMTYKAIEHDKYKEYTTKLRKIVNCEYVAEYALPRIPEQLL